MIEYNQYFHGKDIIVNITTFGRKCYSIPMKTWTEFFKIIKEKDYSKRLNSFLNEEYSKYTCYPPRALLFNAFNHTELSDVKVVIFGQDPYHEPGQAMGMSFSVPKGMMPPPSLINIYKEISNEYKCEMDFDNGDLTYLADQGVLLLNSVLSVRAHQPLSHNIKEYALFFMDVLEVLESRDQPIVYLLWGGNAKKFKPYIVNKKHYIIESVHPSPLAANRGGWFGNGVFKKANDYLISNNLKPIDWCNKK